jgi:hypothetical protein
MADPKAKFRSVQEVQRYLKQQEDQLRLDFQLIDQNMKELTGMVKAAELRAIEVKVLDFSGNGKKRKRSINVDFPVVDVPNKDKLEKNYRQAEQLSQQYKALVQTENDVKMTFRGATNPNFTQLMSNFTKLKADIEKKLKELFTKLSQVADGHAPKEYKAFLANLADDLNSNQHIECDSINTFTYVALGKTGELMFAGYIVLVNAVSDEGKTVPHLYVTVRWTVGGDVEVFVEHDFTEPTLLNGGSIVENTKEATKAIVTQLSLEGFSSQIGNLPLSMQMREPSGGLSKDAFSAAPFVDTIEAHKEELIFNLKPGLSTKQIDEIKMGLYLEVKTLLKNKRNAKLKMRTTGDSIEFTVSNLDQSGVTPYDLEFLQEKYKLNDSQIRKIANEISNG